MKAKKIYYEKCFNLGNYQNEKVGIEIELEEGEKVQDVLKAAKQFVETNNPKASEQVENAQRVVQRPSGYNYDVVIAAQKVLDNQTKEELPF